MTVLYGSGVADSTLTSACDMASASGGSETSANTVIPSSSNNNYTELLSKGTASGTSYTALPSPTGSGWVYATGAGTFAAGNWSASVTMSQGDPGSSAVLTATIRFYKYSGGVYTSIGSISYNYTAGDTSKTTIAFTATSMPATTFASSDLLYVDLFFFDNSGCGGTTYTVYESTSATAGVASDMQVTTSSFTAGTPVVSDIATRFVLVDPPAPITLYGSAVADATLTTACDMTRNTGGTETSKTTTPAANQNFVEIYSQGNAAAPDQPAIQPPTGNGWVYAPGAGSFDAANWSASLTLSFNGMSGTPTLTLRFFRDSGGVYTAIGSLSATVSTTAKTTYAFGPSTLSSLTFGGSDLLYIDLWYNDSAGGVIGDNPVVYEASSAIAGVSGDMQITTGLFTPAQTVSLTPRWHRPRWVLRPLMGGLFTPFQTIPAWVERAITGPFVRPTQPVNIPHYVRRSLTNVLLNYGLNISTRFRLMQQRLKDITTRFRLAQQAIRDITSRFRLMQQGMRDITSRFRLKSADQLKDITSRFRLTQQSLRDVASRFRLMQQSVRDIASRFRVAKLNDIAARFRLGLLKDIASRFRLMQQVARDVSTRFRLGLLKDITTRFRLAKLQDISTRFRLASVNQQLKDIASRFRLRSADQLKDTASRFRLGLVRDVVTRLRLGLVRDTATRFRLMQSRAKDVTARFRLMQQSVRDTATRLRLMSANQLRDTQTRLRLRSADSLHDLSTRFLLRGLGTQVARDLACRLVLFTPPDVVWVTRDMKAVWVTRDEKGNWNTRDDKTTWETRDEQDTWATRDEKATWKTRR